MAGRLPRLSMVAAVLVGALAMLSSQAIATSPRVCRQLEAELASAGSGGGSRTEVRRYDRSIARQRSELQSARRQARSAACGFSLFGGGRAKCASLNSKIEKMERNLDALQRKRAELSGRSAGRSRAKILAAIDANGCRDRREERTARREPGGIRQLDQLDDFDYEEPLEGGERVRRTITPDGVLGPEFFADTGPKEFRTLCVRTCDGYFFPMSSASSRGDFARDQHNCEAACPGAQVEVYYHRAEGEETPSMVSAAGDVPYAQLSTAYLYKTTGAPRPAGCGCSRPPQNFEIVAGNAPEALQSEPITPVPAPRPDPAADPETLANLEGGLTAATIARMAVPRVEKTSATTPSPTGERKVRVVGPVFLPDPEGAIDLRAPARKEVR